MSKIYDQPLPNGKIIVRVDALNGLKDLWGENIMMSRNITYSIISGNVDDDLYHKYISSYYSKFSKFAEFVDSVYIFGDKKKSLITRILDPARESINKYADDMNTIMQSRGGRLLIRTHEFLYYAFTELSEDIRSNKEVTIIC